MEGFPFSCPIEVRYRDIDAMDHVNNAVYVTYLEMARTKLWRGRVGPADSAREVPFIVARIAIDYRSPIGFAEQAEIGIGVRTIGNSSFTLAYRIEAGGRLAAEAESVQVLFDYSLGRPTAIAGELRAKLEALLMPPTS